MERHDYEICKDLFITSNVLHRYLDQQMPCDAVTGGQGRMLGFVIHKYEQGEKICQKDMEREFLIRGSSVTSSLKLLESRGLITRENAKEDARLKYILPTQEGIRVHNEVCEILHNFEDEMHSMFSKEELSLIQEMLQKLRKKTYHKQEDDLC